MIELNGLYCVTAKNEKKEEFFVYHKTLQSAVDIHGENIENIQGPMTVKNIDEIEANQFELLGFFMVKAEDDETEESEDCFVPNCLKKTENVFFPESLDLKRHELKSLNHCVIIETNSYSGNFERELCSFLTGVEHHFGTSIARKERMEFEDDIENGYIAEYIAEQIKEKMIWVDHEEYSDVWCSVCAINGKNDYRSVALFFNDFVGEDLMTYFKKRSIEWAENNFGEIEIKNVYLYENSELYEVK